jgi:cytochrome b561
MSNTISALRNSATAWGHVAKLFHWLGALLVLFLVAHGWWMTHLVARAGRLEQYALHAAAGYYLLSLLALRLAWRLGNAVPVLPAELPRWRRGAARGAHWLLYILMLFVSISGWMVADTFRQPIETTLFGFIRVPHLLDASHRSFRALIEEAHAISSYVLLGLAAVHVVGALNHHFWQKNDVLRRMGWRLTG